MNRWLRAVAGGIAGTAVLSIVLLFLEVEIRNALVAFDAVVQVVGVPGRRGIGFPLFVLAGSVAWPLLVAALESRLGEGDTHRRGMTFAVVLWVGFVTVGGVEDGDPWDFKETDQFTREWAWFEARLEERE